jgi:hypothetical protein
LGEEVLEEARLALDFAFVPARGCGGVFNIRKRTASRVFRFSDLDEGMDDPPPDFEQPLDPFEGPKHLIAGAEVRLAELKPICEAIGKSCGYEIITDFDHKAKENVVKLRLKERFPPRIRSIASMICKELRLALDQALLKKMLATLPKPHSVKKKPSPVKTKAK